MINTTLNFFRSSLFPATLLTFILCAAAAFADVNTNQFAGPGNLIVAEAYYGPGGIVSSADDTSFANTSYLVVDHGDGNTPVAFGYRWNDPASSGETMFVDVMFGTIGNSNDEELFAKVQTFSFGKLVLGIGYNSDGDGNWGDLSDATSLADFSAAGGFLESVQVPDLISSSDTADSYQEGDTNFTRTWVYFDSQTNPYSGASASWGDPAATGFSDRILTNGSWDGWSFDLDLTVYGDAPPTTPVTVAVPEPGSLLFLWAGGITIWLRRSRR